MNTVIAENTHDMPQEQIVQNCNYFLAQVVAKTALKNGLITKEEFNCLTELNRNSFPPFLVEILPKTVAI